MVKANEKEYMDYLMSIPKETYIKILEHCASDVYVTDKNMNIIYVNPNSIRHYGVHPEDMVGVNSDEFRKGKWAPSALDLCMKEKRTVFAEQNYLLIGKSVSTVLTPIFDKNGEIEMVVAIANEIPTTFDTTWRKEANDSNSNKKSKRHDAYLRDDIVGVSYLFYKMLNTIQKVSKSEVPILLTGESGVGKTLIAEYVHNTSNRKDGPFFAINCAAIPENLLESELFGYEPHSFTGASIEGKRGLLELADGGTLFLDEIADMSPALQAKLLDVIENQRFIRIGGKKMMTVDVRIVSATNADLEDRVKHKKFRNDLFWRINTLSFEIPALRKRREDILPLLMYFLKKNNEKYEKNIDFSPDAMAILIAYDWPGNTRQLKNIVERIVLLMQTNDIVQPLDLPEFIIEDMDVEENKTYRESLDNILDSVNRILVREAYKRHENIKKVAEELQISSSRAYRQVHQYCSDLLK